MMFLVVAAMLVVPAQAATVEIEMTGTVEWNFARSYPLTEVNPGDPVTWYWEVDSEVFTNSMNFNTRGYHVDAPGAMLTMGDVTIGLAEDPYGRIPYFVLRESDPVADGFFVSQGSTDWPFPGLTTEVYGFCGPFEAHLDISYTGDTLQTLDILDALGTYAYDGLTRFYTNLVDCGFEVIGIDFSRLEIRLAPVEVPFDVKPGSCPNPLNTRNHGVLPTAIMGTGDLDVTTIDPASLRLAGIPALRSGYEDVGAAFVPYLGKSDCNMDCNEDMPDGWMDLTAKFDSQAIIAALGGVADGECVAVPLTGNFKEEFGGGPIIGEDVMVILDRGFSLMPIGGDRLSPEDPGFTDLGGGSNQLDRAR
jgi:hypothetical protein